MDWFYTGNVPFPNNDILNHQDIYIDPDDGKVFIYWSITQQWVFYTTMEETFDIPTTSDNNALLVDLLSNRVSRFNTTYTDGDLVGWQKSEALLLLDNVMNSEKIHKNIIINKSSELDLAYQYNEELEPSGAVIGWTENTTGKFYEEVGSIYSPDTEFFFRYNDGIGWSNLTIDKPTVGIHGDLYMDISTVVVNPYLGTTRTAPILEIYNEILEPSGDIIGWENIVTDYVNPANKIYIDTDLTFLIRVNTTNNFVDWEHIIYDLIVDADIIGIPIGGMYDNDLMLLKDSNVLYKYNEELKINNVEVGWEILGPLTKLNDNVKPTDASSNHNDVFIDILNTKVFQYTNVIEPSGASFGWQQIYHGEEIINTTNISFGDLTGSYTNLH